MQQTEIRFIEMHDAKVRSVVIASTRRVVVVFEHLPVYRQEGASENVERLWSYRATLEAANVRVVSSDVVLENDNWVSNGYFGARDEEDGNFALFVDGHQPCSGFSLEFASGATLKVECESMRIRLGPSVSTDEIWVDGEPQPRVVR